MPTTRSRFFLIAGVIATSVLALTACAGSSGTDASSTAPALQIGAVDLSGVCPAKIVIQTDWNPEAEHGHLYELLGPNPTIDAGKKSVSGPLYAAGAYTGVDVEIRAGGPAIGFQTVTSQMYSDPDITLGYVATDEAVQLSDSMPTTAVFAPLDISPLMVMWDPKTYPQAKTIKDIADAGAYIRYFGGSAYMEYLNSSGLIPAAQADGSYDGTPASFVAAGGKDAQQGFASAEPYVYEHEVPAWGKPVKFQLIYDTGYAPYISSVSVRSGELKGLSACLTKLVPVLQQAEVDYYTSPAAVNSLILALVDQYATGWVYSQGVADYSVKTQLDLGLVGNGDNKTIGDFDTARVDDLIAKTTPIFTKLGSAPATGLTADDLVTNKFIDPKIGLSK